MLPAIVEHVRQGPPDFTRRSQDVLVKAVAEDPATTPPQLVERASQPHQQPAHPARESGAVGRLDDEVQVIGLHRELRQPESVPFTSRGERLQDGSMSARPPQGGQPSGVYRMTGCMRRPRTVRHTRPITLRFAPGSSPPPSPTVPVRKRGLSSPSLAQRAASGRVRTRSVACHARTTTSAARGDAGSREILRPAFLRPFEVAPAAAASRSCVARRAQPPQSQLASFSRFALCSSGVRRGSSLSLRRYSQASSCRPVARSASA